MCETELETCNSDKSTLNLQNKQDREVVAMALYRAGYTVREIKRKENGKDVVLLEYWR